MRGMEATCRCASVLILTSGKRRCAKSRRLKSNVLLHPRDRRRPRRSTRPGSEDVSENTKGFRRRTEPVSALARCRRLSSSM